MSHGEGGPGGQKSAKKRHVLFEWPHKMRTDLSENEARICVYVCLKLDSSYLSLSKSNSKQMDNIFWGKV